MTTEELYRGIQTQHITLDDFQRILQDFTREIHDELQRALQQHYANTDDVSTLLSK